MEALYRRVVFDATGVLVGTFLGYRLLVYFVRTEGLATVRMHTELALAHGIQATLVPTLAAQIDRFEVYGKSIPSTDMGGDLIDVVKRDGGLFAYSGRDVFLLLTDGISEVPNANDEEFVSIASNNC